MTKNLQNWLEEYNNMEDKRVVWELLKYHIRKSSMTYSSVKKLDNNILDHQLQIRLAVLESNLDKDESLLEEYENVKQKLKELDKNKIDGMIFR